MNSKEPEVSNSLPCRPIVADGGVSSLLISVVYHQIHGLADVEWENVVLNRDVTTVAVWPHRET